MKSIVIDVKGKKAILLHDDGQFVATDNNNYSIGDVIMSKKLTQKRSFAIAAIAAVFVLLLSVSAFAYMTPYYYVSVDVNPSVLIKANWFERVIGMEAVNADAKTVISDVNWMNKSIEQVIDETLQKIEQEGYFEQSGEVLISSTARNKDKAAKLAEKLSGSVEFASLDNTQMSSEVIGYEMVQSAKELGITPGKYNLITNLLGIDPENADEYMDLSVEDLMKIFTATKGVDGKETAAEAMTKKADADTVDKSDEIADGKQIAEQKSSEAEQRATERREEAEEKASEGTQAATEQRQEAEEKVSEATQAATEQRQEAEEKASEATQAATAQQQEAEEKASEATQAVTEPTQPVDNTNIPEVVVDPSGELDQFEGATSQTTPSR